jgi:dienelactone hydrolase
MTITILRVLFLLSLVSISIFPRDGATYGLFNSHQDAGVPIQVPIVDDQGHQWLMKGHICRPEGVSRPRLVVINHGSPPRSSDRPGMSPESCDSEAVQWFVHRHYAVVLVLRLGYGATGGPWAEGYDGCDNADYYQSGLETAREIKTIVDYVVTLPAFDPSGVIVVGQSAGGWGILAYDSIDHPNVLAFINMAGGRGGHHHDRPNSNCHPEGLVEATAKFGKTASTPMLWVYTKNDSYFNPNLAAAMHQAFTQAGGKADLVTPRAYGDDGHHLFFGRNGSVMWGPLVEAYLEQTTVSSANHSGFDH